MPAVLEKEPSKSDWSIIKDVTNRQIGFNNSVPSRFYSSLHAVQRLELMYKLEEHQVSIIKKYNINKAQINIILITKSNLLFLF